MTSPIRNLLIAAWVIFVLDLVVFGLMVREVLVGDFGTGDTAADDHAYAVAVTVGVAVWICAINLVLVVSWWRQNSTGLWIAIIAGGMPLLWAWTAAVQAIGDAVTLPTWRP